MIKCDDLSVYLGHALGDNFWQKPEGSLFVFPPETVHYYPVSNDRNSGVAKAKRKAKKSKKSRGR